mgnify:FL=1
MEISLKIKFSNYLLVAVLQAVPAVCRGISLKIQFSNYSLVAVLQAVLAVCRRIKNGNRFLPASCVGQYKKK